MRKRDKEVMSAMIVKVLNNHFEIKMLKEKLSGKIAKEQELESTVYLLEKRLGALIDYLKVDFKVIPAKPMQIIKGEPERVKAIKKIIRK